LVERQQPAVPVARRGGARDAVSRVVAVTAGRRTDDGRERVALNSVYVRALAGAGLVPVIVPPLGDPETAVSGLDAVAGLVLTGGDDVDPARYGAAPHARLGETDPARDAVEAALISGARERGLPILAICRGIQILNVALGGTLYQDLPSERPGPIDHANEGSCHGIEVVPDSLLCRTIGVRRGSVNSRHHQAVRDLAPGLAATAWADDGVIEAAEPAERGGPWVLAVQWHPEEEVEGALFRGFARALR
jgi:putative glutamine amidotransferase